MATTKGKVTLQVEVDIEIFCDTCGNPLIAFQAVNSVKDKKYLSVCPCEICKERIIKQQGADIGREFPEHSEAGVFSGISG